MASLHVLVHHIVVKLGRGSEVFQLALHVVSNHGSGCLVYVGHSFVLKESLLSGNLSDK